MRHLASMAFLFALVLPALASADGAQAPLHRVAAPIYAARPGASHPYAVRLGQWSAGFSAKGVTLRLAEGDGTSALVTWRIAGMREVAPRAEAPLGITVGEAIGRDGARYGLTGYRDVRWPGIAPHVDLLFRSGSSELEWLLEAGPGQRSRRFTVLVDGVDDVGLDGQSVLRLRVGRGELVERGLSCAQPAADGRAVEAKCGYAGIRQIGPRAWRYDIEATGLDPSRGLTVDPDYFWSAPFGGTAHDGGKSVCLYGTSYVVAGETASTDFPTLSRTAGGMDAFVSVVSSDLTTLSALYVGGANDESMQALACGTDSVYVTGKTASADFIATATEQNAEGYLARVTVGGAALTLAAKIGFGGAYADEGTAVSVVPGGAAVVVAGTTCPDAACLQTDVGLYWFPKALGTAGLTYSFGGAASERPTDVVALSNAEVEVVGKTNSTDLGTKFATVAGGLFHTATTANGTGFLVGVSTASGTPTPVHYSLFGGSGVDSVAALRVDGDAYYLAGTTTSADFKPLSAAGTVVDTSLDVAGGDNEGFVIRLDRDGSTSTFALAWSTALGAAGTDDTVAALGAIGTDLVVAGTVNCPTGCAGFPGLVDDPATGSQDGFVTRLTTDGKKAWTRVFGTASTEYVRGVVSQKVGALTPIVVVGSTTTLTFPSGGLTFDQGKRGGDADAFLYATDVTPPVVQNVVDGSGADVDVTTVGLVAGATVDDPEDDPMAVNAVLFYTRTLDAGCGPTAVLTQDLRACQVAGAPPWSYSGPDQPLDDTKYFAVVQATNSTGLTSFACSDGVAYKPSDASVPGSDAAAPKQDAAAPGPDAASPGLDAGGSRQDATSPAPDANAAKVDGGPKPTDAAEPDLDAGAEPLDAEAPAADAAAVATDAATPRPDASTGADAGDAGNPKQVGVLGWSCDCTAAGGGAMPLFAAAVPLLALRRRRAR